MAIGARPLELWPGVIKAAGKEKLEPIIGVIRKKGNH